MLLSKKVRKPCPRGRVAVFSRVALASSSGIWKVSRCGQRRAKSTSPDSVGRTKSSGASWPMARCETRKLDRCRHAAPHRARSSSRIEGIAGENERWKHLMLGNARTGSKYCRRQLGRGDSEVNAYRIATVKEVSNAGLKRLQIAANESAGLPALGGSFTRRIRPVRLGRRHALVNAVRSSKGPATFRRVRCGKT